MFVGLSLLGCNRVAADSDPHGPESQARARRFIRVSTNHQFGGEKIRRPGPRSISEFGSALPAILKQVPHGFRKPGVSEHN